MMRPGRLARRNRADSGFTLFEVAFAAVVVGLAVVAGVSALGTSASARASVTMESVTPFLLGAEMHVLAEGLPRGPGDGSPARQASDVVALEDLAGASFAPPINARLVARSDLATWKQEVALRKVALADPKRVATVADGSAWLWELTATIRESGVERGAYRWWIRP